MKTCITVLSLLFIISTSAQDFQGVATYKSHRKMDFKMDGVDEKSEMHKKIMEQMKKQFQKEYTLIFTKEESMYKENESLSTPKTSSSGISISVSNGSDALYKNLKETRFTNETELLSKRFLVKDTLKNQVWKLVNETKYIGDYTCRKAVFKATYKTKTMSADGGLETVEKERETVAWYTMEIPVNNGPSVFNGLPGLILEINDGELTLVCTKIVLNPDKKTKIEEPTKGKEVSQDEFNEIMKKKNEEMMTKFKSGSNGTVIESFSIGG